MTEPIILIVDDEKNTREGLLMALEDEFDCYLASGIAEALQVLKNENIDVLLTDLRMGADSGMDLLRQAQKLPNPPVSIMMTAYGSVDTAVEAMRNGAWHFITKPLNLDEVELLTKRAIQHKKRTSQAQVTTLENTSLAEKKITSAEKNKTTKSTPPTKKEKTTKQQTKKEKNGLQKLLGNSPAMQHLHQMIQQVARSKATVLIEGESGTGKELVAQAIHALSDRPHEKMITVNCAALSPQLLESELFGHEKGAFTGASQRRVGRFEQAHGGTLFLDEIGEIDASTQVKLLRALSERTIERVGSNTSLKVDVRIVTATNKDLAQLVQEQSFREDLYFRLNVVKLNTPPLRHRKTDIALLVQYFLQEFAEENEKKIQRCSAEALTLLEHYSWPGNVRELRTTIEHGVVMCNENSIQIQHLPNRIHATSSPALKTPPNSKETEKTQTQPIQEPLKEQTLTNPSFNLAEIERYTIEKALETTKGNRKKAAALLGISRRTLHRKLNSYHTD